MKRGRPKRKLRNINNWRANAAKKAKNYGMAGISKTCKPIKKRQMGIGCGKCRYDCQLKITIDERRKIFEDYWSLGDHQRQWDFIDRLTVSSQPVEIRSTMGVHKTISRKYFLTKSKERVKVCQTMFLQTFGK